MTTKIVCAQCKRPARKATGAVRRSWRIGAPVYCGRRCAGLARRKHKTKTQRTEEKRLYDAAYREKNLARLKAQKRAYHLRTYDPVKAAKDRKKKMARHVEYCRQPAYKAKKHAYDARRYAEQFGPFADCHRLLKELNAEIAGRMSRYDIYMANGRYDKYAERRRQRRLEDAEAVSR